MVKNIVMGPYCVIFIQPWISENAPRN